MKEKSGTTWSILEPWKQPRSWSKILMRFEGLSYAVNPNFVFNLGKLWKQCPDTKQDKKSLRHVLLNFRDIKVFVNYLTACMGVEVIHRKAQVTGTEEITNTDTEKWLLSLHNNSKQSGRHSISRKKGHLNA